MNRTCPRCCEIFEEHRSIGLYTTKTCAHLCMCTSACACLYAYTLCRRKILIFQGRFYLTYESPETRNLPREFHRSLTHACLYIYRMHERHTAPTNLFVPFPLYSLTTHYRIPCFVSISIVGALAPKPISLRPATGCASS